MLSLKYAGIDSDTVQKDVLRYLKRLHAHTCQKSQTTFLEVQRKEGKTWGTDKQQRLQIESKVTIIPCYLRGGPVV